MSIVNLKLLPLLLLLFLAAIFDGATAKPSTQQKKKNDIKVNRQRYFVLHEERTTISGSSSSSNGQQKKWDIRSNFPVSSLNVVDVDSSITNQPLKGNDVIVVITSNCPAVQIPPITVDMNDNTLDVTWETPPQQSNNTHNESTTFLPPSSYKARWKHQGKKEYFNGGKCNMKKPYAAPIKEENTPSQDEEDTSLPYTAPIKEGAEDTQQQPQRRPNLRPANSNVEQVEEQQTSTIPAQAVTSSTTPSRVVPPPRETWSSNRVVVDRRGSEEEIIESWTSDVVRMTRGGLRRQLIPAKVSNQAATGSTTTAEHHVHRVTTNSATTTTSNNGDSNHGGGGPRAETAPTDQAASPSDINTDHHHVHRVSHDEHSGSATVDDTTNGNNHGDGPTRGSSSGGPPSGMDPPTSPTTADHEDHDTTASTTSATSTANTDDGSTRGTGATRAGDNANTGTIASRPSKVGRGSAFRPWTERENMTACIVNVEILHSGCLDDNDDEEAGGRTWSPRIIKAPIVREISVRNLLPSTSKMNTSQPDENCSYNITGNLTFPITNQKIYDTSDTSTNQPLELPQTTCSSLLLP